MQEAEAEVVGVPDMPVDAAVQTREMQAQQTEIAASIVRSSLAELETKTTAMLARLENVRSTVPSQRQTPPSPDVPSLPFTGTPNEPSKKSYEEVMTSLEQLLAELLADDEQEFVLPSLDEVSQLAVLQHSTAAYMGSLERHQLARIVTRLGADSSTWLGGLFKFDDCNLSYCRDDAECTLQALRLALVLQHGENKAEARPPAIAPSIYLSELSQLFTLQNACRYLGLPLSCIRMVSIRDGQMDVAELEALLAADIAAGRQPLMLIATVGNPLTGGSDDLLALGSICASKRIWLHCQGLGLAALALTKSWVLKPKRLPNSMTLSLNSWLGLIGVPSVLVHKPSMIISKIGTVFESDPILSNRVACLSVWSVLQSLGVDGVTDRIFAAFDMCQSLCKILVQFEGISLLSKESFQETSELYRFALEDALSYNVLFELGVPTVLFQFDGHTETRSRNVPESEPAATGIETGVDVAGKEITEPAPSRPFSPTPDGVEKNATNAQYYDRLNSWLGQILLRDCGQLSLEMIEHEQHGICIRYCPFAPGYAEQLSRAPEILAAFAGCLETQLEILLSTIRHRARFQQLVAQSDVLQLIELHDWAGLGGVYYVPEGWETLLTDQTKGELNKLNTALVEALQATDSAFSHAESSDGLTCVRFGMVTSETDVEELLELVVHTARLVQENSKILDTMSEILKKGIEAATIDLQREAEEKLWQEGILRQVPLVGRVVNWWSPPAKETGMKGRSLNLTQGVVESTENIYKYHMQMTPKTSHQLPGNKVPPAPLVQKAINTDPDRSVQHSRNASSSSELSGIGVGRSNIPILAKSPQPPQQQQQQQQQYHQQQQQSQPTTVVAPSTPASSNKAADPQASSTPVGVIEP